MIRPPLERTISARASGITIKRSDKKPNRTMDEGVRGKKKTVITQLSIDFKKNLEAEVKHYFRIK